jgi:serine phosphatase RsbU (regulator of sigma subunit)
MSNPAFTILDPDGNRTVQDLLEFPFTLGRQAGNHLMIRDARASRHHAHVLQVEGDYILEDLQSRHGVHVNGERVDRRVLQDGDQICFGVPDSFTLVFHRPGGSRVTEIAEHLAETGRVTAGAGGNLARLRAVLEVSRALQSSFSVDAVLNALVDAALVVTNAERGFLLLKQPSGDLVVRSARDRRGPLSESDLAVPRNLIRKALEERPQTFSMQFSANLEDPSSSAYQLELKSVVAVPLVRIRIAADGAEQPLPTETAGVLYMDSRLDPRDMAAGNRELLETLGVEASIVLENARLLEEDRARQHIHEELAIARNIQQSLLPRELPETGWLRAVGYSLPSRQVGGDYYDTSRIDADTWAIVVADVAGKGVGSALVAALLQGAFLGLDENPESMRHTLARLNVFIRDRTPGQKHATVFCALVRGDGNLHYINAGHCAPILLRAAGVFDRLEPASPPVGLLADATFDVERRFLQPGDRLVIYSDGLTDSQNSAGEYFGRARLQEIILAQTDQPAAALHQAILDSAESFTAGQEQTDDLTLVVLEYRPEPLSSPE